MSSDITLDYQNRAVFCLNSVYFSKEPINFLHGFFICALLKQQQQNIFCQRLLKHTVLLSPFFQAVTRQFNHNLIQSNLILSLYNEYFSHFSEYSTKNYVCISVAISQIVSFQKISMPLLQKVSQFEPPLKFWFIFIKDMPAQEPSGSSDWDYSGFCSMKRLGEFLLPPKKILLPLGRVMLLHCRITLSIMFTGTHLYTWVERGTVRVNCLAQEHNAVSSART